MDTGREQLAEAITTFLLGTNKVSSGYGLFIEGVPSAFFSQFSLRRLAKKNASTAGVLCDEAGIGSGGGGGEGSKQAAYSKFETFSCQLKSSDTNKFDESEFISTLKRDVEQEVKQSGLTIRNSQSPDSGSFYLEYEEDAMKGRVEISGERRERYYTLTASLIEREAKEKQSE